MNTITNIGCQLMTTPLVFLFVMASPMRVSATQSPTNPNINPDYNKLPALDNGKIKWDGIPSFEFMETFFNPLRMALGAISENGMIANHIAELAPFVRLAQSAWE